MARNQHAVIWTRISGKPEKMGDLVLTDEQAFFTYTKAYIASAQAGFSLLGDSRIWGSDTVTYPISERIPVFPRLLSLLPGNNPRNLQRRHYINMLRTRAGKEPPPGMETEWQLLVMGGHGGIGHIDVFGDDIRAEAWYQKNRINHNHRQEVSDSRSQLWRMLKHDVLDENIDFDPHIIEETLGPTPSVGGMIPKLLVSISPDDKNARFYPPASQGKTDVVLKVEPPEYKGLLDLEALCLEIHREAGFEVPSFQRYQSDALEFLAVERFDRIDDHPIPMESLFSVIASGNHQFRETGDILLDELGNIMQQLAQVANLRQDSSETLYRRIIFALLTGNGDLHLENLSLLGGLEDCRISPVYDPAPMRAWPRHNIISAIPFDPSLYKNHTEFFIKLGKSFNLTKNKIREIINQSLDQTTYYGERVMQLQKVPLRQREQLTGIFNTERLLLKQAL